MKLNKYWYFVGFVLCYTLSMYLFQLINDKLMVAGAVLTLGIALLINSGFGEHLETKHKD